MTQPTEPSGGLCLGCNYPLRDLADSRCPECGRPFDIRDPRTCNLTGRPFGTLHRRILRIPAWPIPLIAFALLFVQLWLERYPEDIRLYHLLWFHWSWLALGVAWLIRTIIIPLEGLAFPRDMRPRRHRWLWFVPFLFVIVLLATSFNWGFHLAYTLSRPSLNRFAAEALDAFPTADWKPRWIGLYHPSAVISTNHMVMIQMHYGTYFAYAPDGLPKWATETDRESLPLGPKDWYLVHNFWPLSHLQDMAAEDNCQSLVKSPDHSPRATAYLLASLSRREPQNYFGYHEQTNRPHFIYYDSESHNTVRADIQALVRLGPDAVVPLAAALTSGSSPPMNCLGALGILGPIAAPAAPQIIPFLTNPDPRIREAAAWAFGRLGSAASTRAAVLLPLLNDLDPYVENDARIAFEGLHPDIAIQGPALIDYWSKNFTRYDPPVKGPRYVQHSEAAWANHLMVVDQISLNGPAAAAVAPQIIQTMHDVLIYLHEHPKPEPPVIGDISDLQFEAWSLRPWALVEGTKMLAAISPNDPVAPTVTDARDWLRNHPEYHVTPDPLDPQQKRALRQFATRQGIDSGNGDDFNPQFLPLLMEMTQPPNESVFWDNDRAKCIVWLARKTPVPIERLSPLALGVHNGDTATALLNATGTPAQKVNLLVGLLNNNWTDETYADAARALITLRATGPAVHNVLFLRANASDMFDAREACTAALNALYPLGP